MNEREKAMNEPRVIRTPGGEELVLLTRDEYEDLRDAAIAATRTRELAQGREELVPSEDVKPYLAAPTPLAFWRKKRGIRQIVLANDVGVSQSFLSDVERGKAIGDIVLYAKLAKRLDVAIEDLVPSAEATD